MLSIKVGKSLIRCLFPINVFESKLDGSVFRVICRPYTEMICDYFNWGYAIYLLDSILVKEEVGLVFYLDNLVVNHGK